MLKSLLYRSGINYQIDVPPLVSLKMGARKYIPVRGYVNNTEFRATLIPRKKNRHVIFLNAEIRRKAKLNLDDKVEISFEYDPESRDIPIPEDVELILSESEQVYETFLNLAPSHRRELLKYILMAKRDETRLRRIEHIAKRMRERIDRKYSSD